VTPVYRCVTSRQLELSRLVQRLQCAHCTYLPSQSLQLWDEKGYLAARSRLQIVGKRCHQNSPRMSPATLPRPFWYIITILQLLPILSTTCHYDIYRTWVRRYARRTTPRGPIWGCFKKRVCSRYKWSYQSRMPCRGSVGFSGRGGSVCGTCAACVTDGPKWRYVAL
jgi:hypothetical protein